MQGAFGVVGICLPPLEKHVGNIEHVGSVGHIRQLRLLKKFGRQIIARILRANQVPDVFFALCDKYAVEPAPAPKHIKQVETETTLFKPHINYKFYPDPKMGWSDLALGGLDIVELPVNPHAMLVQPFVQELAARLKERLHRLQSKPESLPGPGLRPGVVQKAAVTLF